MKTVTFEVDGMHCDSCAARIKTVLEMEPGVHEATASFANGLVQVRYNPHVVSEDQLTGVIERGGFSVPARES